MFKSYKKFKESGNHEGGNTFVMYVMMFGLMVVFLGFAIDSGMGYYTKNGMQSALDSAVVAGVSNPGGTKYNSAGKRVINQEGATKVALASFKESRVNYPNLLDCNEKGQCTKITSAVKSKTGRGQYFTMTATIYSKNVFLHMINLPTQSYTLVSDTRLGSIIEK